MAQIFAAGDDLIFQLESGFGLLRVIAIDERLAETTWHLMAYEELFPDVESAERALGDPASLHIRKAHIALTTRAFERTPAARLGNRPVTESERAAFQEWVASDGKVSDRSALFVPAQRRERTIETWKPRHYDVAISFNEQLNEISSARTEIDLEVLAAN